MAPLPEAPNSPPFELAARTHASSMIVAAKESHFRSAQQTRNCPSDQKGKNHESKQSEDDVQRGIAVRLWWVRRPDRQETHKQSDEGKGAAHVCTLLMSHAADDFRAAAGAHACTLRNLRIAVRADQHFHVVTIPRKASDRERIFVELADWRDAYTCDKSCLVTRGFVSLGNGTHPFDGKILQRLEEIAEVTSRQFDFAAGEDQAKRVFAVDMGKRGGDELLIREDVCFAPVRLYSDARTRSFTLPARWSELRTGFAVVAVVFHVGFEWVWF